MQITPASLDDNQGASVAADAHLATVAETLPLGNPHPPGPQVGSDQLLDPVHQGATT